MHSFSFKNILKRMLIAKFALENKYVAQR